MTVQLRTYTTQPGKLPDWSRLFAEKIRPLRTEVGFTVLGAWAVPERDQFVWVLSHPGTPAEFDAAEKAYYASPAHAPLDAEAKGYLAKGDTVFVDEA